MDPQAFPSSGRSSNNNNADIDPNHHTNAAFSQRLRQMGVATPNPTLSNSSTVNSHGGFSRNNNNNSSNNASRFVQDPSLSRETPATTTKQQQQQQPSPTTVSTNKTSTSSLGSPRDSSRPLPTGRATTTSTQQQQGGRGGGGNSNSTTLNALQVRKELAERAQHEFERGGNVDREFLDVNTLRQILVLAERGGGGGGDVDAAQIEKRLNLKKGVVARLVGGKAKGVFGPLEV
ncbi:uncharacterized protein B0I36DRAFT_327716 [Microdochium trichocladiopsis]|uniref:Helix-turn-helix domain-containing protein n=1 Tax=Microdochium trichocladiopsis TaxID=1682393 RepID=A0A9P9BL49_9PEZI|nr:uncharacterized protein B0I36DRAFT_327716 [Microdochium trichocladiopsis]KAH7027712.1 hypothetical protein B0I36DRAFT_327716 [Microdochium trichocladiopsis]